MFRRVCALLLLLAVPLLANIKLFLKDGTYHLVREYTVEADRVRYYSTERQDWEEIPLDLVDLKKTKAEEEAKATEEEAAAKADAEEEAFDRQQRAEIAMIPADAGLYMANEGKLTTYPAAEVKARTPKGRSILKAISPIPLIMGKTYVELDGESSKMTVDSDRPEFYFRLAELERFQMVRLSPKKGVRLVQTWHIVPVTNEILEEHEPVEIFRQQFYNGLYKIWPTKPLVPGEYAVIEYTEGKANTRVWDFRVSPSAAK